METVGPIEGNKITLPDPRLDPSRTNIVRAYRILINGSVALHGQNLALYASEVSFQSGGMIDTSGAAPDRDFTTAPAIDRAAPGEKGKDGDAGSQGRNGGTIRIWAERISGAIILRTAGGAGGRGRDGGKGQTGRAGPDAPQRLIMGTSNVGSPVKTVVPEVLQGLPEAAALAGTLISAS